MEAMPKFAYDALRIAMDMETLILDKKDNLKIPIKIMAVNQKPKVKKNQKRRRWTKQKPS